jgi:hypothetical protein
MPVDIEPGVGESNPTHQQGAEAQDRKVWGSELPIRWDFTSADQAFVVC